MRRLGIILAVGILAGLLARQQALACPWGGYWEPATAWDNDWSYEPGPRGAPPAASYQGFLDDTSDLRKTLAAKRGEYQALMAGPNPDPKRSAQLSREIVDIQERLRQKAREYGVAGMGHRGRCGWGMGPWGGGWHCGRYCR